MKRFFRARPEIVSLLAAQGVLILFVVYIVSSGLFSQKAEPISDKDFFIGENTSRLDAQVGSSRPLEGEMAPNFSLKSSSGENITLKDYRGEKVLLFFVSTTCPYCNRVAPNARRATQAEKTNLLFISAAGESAKRVTSWAEGVAPEASVGRDASDQVLRDYGVVGTPTFALIDQQGKLQDYFVGERSVSSLRKKIRE